MKKAITSISFLSICIAYSVGLLFFAIEEVLVHGKVDDFGVIIFWSALFELLAWVIFIMLPLRRLDHSKSLFNIKIFPIISTAYAEVIFTILIGWLFFKSDFKIVFVIAAVVGFSFGLIYILLIKNKKVVNFYNGRLLPRLTALLYPALFLWIFFFVFPRLLPATAFRFMPDEIQENIIEGTIPKFKVGDSFEPLNNALPGYFENFQNGVGNMSSTFDDFAFVIQVNCDKIIRLVYGNRDKTDLTIYGDLQNKPCR